MSNERCRIDGRKFREIPLGELSVDAQGRITIRRPAKPDAQADRVARDPSPGKAG
jgi:hypothetical protein